MQQRVLCWNENNKAAINQIRITYLRTQTGSELCDIDDPTVVPWAEPHVHEDSPCHMDLMAKHEDEYISIISSDEDSISRGW